MNLRFYIDPQSGQPHIYNHRIREHEVEEVLKRSSEDRPGRDGARVAVGQTEAGRYLRIIYVPDQQPDSIFVITGYELKGKPLIAHRRRMRRRLQ